MVESSSKDFVICNVNDYQEAARRLLPKYIYEYVASGSDEEQTLAENRKAFAQWYLRPRVMRDVRNINTSVSLLGQALDFPVFVSPAGVQSLCHPQAECASAQACANYNTIFALSQHATKSIEQVKQAAPTCNLWYQCYILKNRDMTSHLLQRAVNAGYRGIFLTVDSVRFGYREADERNGFNSLPEPHRLENYEQELSRTYNSKAHDSWDQNSEQLFDQNTSWPDIAWIKRQCPNLPLIVKGIMTAQDARDAVLAGADGIMVSNHGGRQLDGSLAALDALPEVVAAVGQKVPVLLDSGVRRGTDVLKALALGATAVGIGKPVFFALAVAGQKGVEDVLRLLKKEFETAMALCGLQNVSQVSTDVVCRHPSGSSMYHYQRSKL